MQRNSQPRIDPIEGDDPYASPLTDGRVRRVPTVRRVRRVRSKRGTHYLEYGTAFFLSLSLVALFVLWLLASGRS